MEYDILILISFTILAMIVWIECIWSHLLVGERTFKQSTGSSTCDMHCHHLWWKRDSRNLWVQRSHICEWQQWYRRWGYIISTSLVYEMHQIIFFAVDSVLVIVEVVSILVVISVAICGHQREWSLHMNITLLQALVNVMIFIGLTIVVVTANPPMWYVQSPQV